LHDLGRDLFSILTEGRLENELFVDDFGQSDIGLKKTRSILYERAMTETELFNTSRDHVHKDLLIGDNFGSSFNEIGFHNNKMRVAADDGLTPEGLGT